ncbi:hypothetical protein [Nostoc sp. CCY 9925]|uniref:hypothetical protein n=1 Tax=Nostoc sp. CCY 9925 TaxID=3103865 RepID=UPI0039C656D1
MSHLLYFLSRSSAAKTTVIAVLSGALGMRRGHGDAGTPRHREKFLRVPASHHLSISSPPTHD